MEDFEHDESPRLVIYDLDIGGPGHGDNTDFRTFYKDPQSLQSLSGKEATLNTIL